MSRVFAERTIVPALAWAVVNEILGFIREGVSFSETSGGPICRGILDLPEVPWAIERYTQQPRGTFNRWDGCNHARLLLRAAREQFQHYRGFTFQALVDNNPATVHIDNGGFAFLAKAMCRIKTCDDNRNL